MGLVTVRGGTGSLGAPRISASARSFPKVVPAWDPPFDEIGRGLICLPPYPVSLSCTQAQRSVEAIYTFVLRQEQGRQIRVHRWEEGKRSACPTLR